VKFFFAKASEAEIWTRVHRRYLTSFAGLYFENEPGLTELDAAEDRQNSQLSVSKTRQQRKHYSDVIRQAKIRLYFYRDEGIIGRGLMSYHNSTAESTGK